MGANGKKAASSRREVILKTAARLFREKGYEGTTVRDLAEAVNIQSGSLFFHFRSKEEILLSILEQGLVRAIAILDRNLSQAHTPREKLAAVLRGQLRAILVEDRDAFTTVLVDWRTVSSRSRKKVIALRDEYEGHIKKVLDELSAAGAIPRDNRLFRLFLLGAMNWTVQWYRPDGDLTVDELAEGLLEIVLPAGAQNTKKTPRTLATATR